MMNISWMELYLEMKSRGMTGKNNDRIRVYITSDFDSEVGIEPSFKEYTYTEVVENALIEVMSLIPSVSDLDKFHEDIFDRVSMKSKLSTWIFDTRAYLTRNNIKNV